MKKHILLILCVILCLAFTACTDKSTDISESGPLNNGQTVNTEITEKIPQNTEYTTQEYIFDLSECDDEKFVQSIKDGRRYDLFSIEGSGIIALGTEIDETFENGLEYQIMSYKQLDFDNLAFTEYTEERPQQENAVRWFDYNGKKYVLTMENGEYDEEKGGVFPHLVLTDGDKRTVISENWDYMRIVTMVNGYVIYAEKASEQFNDFNYIIYSIDQDKLLYEEELKNCTAADNYAYLVNWYNAETEQYLHFDCTSGELYDVTEQYNSFREKHPELDSANPTEYQYFADDAFYTFMTGDGWTLFAGDERIDHIKHADLADKELYYCKAEGEQFKVIKMMF